MPVTPAKAKVSEPVQSIITIALEVLEKTLGHQG